MISVAGTWPRALFRTEALGVCTGVVLDPDETVGFPDLCIFVSDALFGGGSFFGQ